MRYQVLLLAAVLASGLAAAETIAVDNGIAVKQSDVATPARGMTMDQVATKFGAPASKVAAVGKPPIARWEYPAFVVYFEADHVIHSVIANSAGGEAAPAESAPAEAAPAAPAPAESAPAEAAPAAPAPAEPAPTNS
jgi:hypothetical protein